MFLDQLTHPGITYIVNYLSHFLTCYNKRYWAVIKNMFIYLIVTKNYGILNQYHKVTIKLIGYSYVNSTSESKNSR